MHDKSHDTAASAVQTKPAFDAALEAMQAAGVQLVPLDMSVLVDFSHKHTPDMLFLTYEMPRELARSASLMITHLPA